MLGDMPMDGRRDRSDSDIAQRKIFIGGLSYGTDDDKLRKYFSAYGAVQDAVVMKDPVSRRSRGFGFITFHDPHSVDVALSNEPHTIDARRVEAKRAVPRSEARDALFPQGLGLQVTGRATTSAWAVPCALHACVCVFCAGPPLILCRSFSFPSQQYTFRARPPRTGRRRRRRTRARGRAPRRPRVPPS